MIFYVNDDDEMSSSDFFIVEKIFCCLSKMKLFLILLKNLAFIVFIFGDLSETQLNSKWVTSQLPSIWTLQIQI